MAEIVVDRHHWPSDACCANCGTELLGNWCHACGQRAADHHRSLKHLAIEAIEGFTHADGRLWRTLSLLVIRPAQLTNEYLRGRRASEIPPLRLFLVILLMVFAFGSMAGHGLRMDLGTKDLAGAHQAISTMTIEGPHRLADWLRAHLLRAVDDPRTLLGAISDWSERFAFLLAPLSAVVLLVLFPLRRDLKLFDHMVFAMHSLSFVGIVWLIIMVTRWSGWAPGLLVFALLTTMPAHLFLHMRGVYHTGVISTLWRMALLFVLTLGIFLLLLTGLAAVSLESLHA